MPTKFFPMRIGYIPGKDTVSNRPSAQGSSLYNNCSAWVQRRDNSNNSLRNLLNNNWGTVAQGSRNIFANILKGGQRDDTILFTEFQVPKHVKIEGGYYALQSAELGTTTAFTGFDFCVFENDIVLDPYAGGRYYRGGEWSQYKWRSILTAERPQDYPYNRMPWECNWDVKLLGSSTNVGQTEYAATGAAGNGNQFYQIGALRTNAGTGQTYRPVIAIGQVIQIEDDTNPIDEVQWRMLRSGTLPSNTNIVIRIYSYDSTTKQMGNLLRTSSAVDASTLSTGAAYASFTISPSLSVTNNERYFVALEPETEWTHQSTSNVQIRCTSGGSAGGKGTEALAEYIWVLGQDTGNSGPNQYIVNSSLPLLYDGIISTANQVDIPYENKISTLTPDKPMQYINSGEKFNFVINDRQYLNSLERLAKARDWDNTQALMTYIASGLPSGSNISYYVQWEVRSAQITDISKLSGIVLQYRSTRTFIT